MSGSGRPDITFVVPVRNDAQRLRRCLASIGAANVNRADIEVIVADNGSNDGSAEVAKAAGARVLDLPGLPVAALRNAAARQARAPVLAFVDADHEVGPGWVDAALADLAMPGVAAAGAPYDPPPTPTWVQRIYDGLRSRPVVIGDTDWLGSGNLAVARDLFQRLGGFDVTLETCEDVDFCRKVKASGARVVADPRLRSIHHGDPVSLRAVFFGEMWRGRDNIRVTLRPPIETKSLLSAAVSVVYLAAIALLVVGVATIPFSGATLVVPAMATLGVLLLLRTARIARNVRRLRVGDLVRTAAVAVAYDTGRALALVAHSTHDVRRDRRK